MLAVCAIARQRYFLHTDAHFDLASTLYQMGRVDEAAGHDREALRLATIEGREDIARLAADRLRRAELVVEPPPGSK